MHKDNIDLNTMVKSEHILNYVKIGIAICLLLFGGYLLLWLINLIQYFINSSDPIPIMQTFLTLEPSQQTLNLTVKGDVVDLTGNGIAKWVLFIVIFIVVFNILGRAIASILSGAVKLLISTKFNSPPIGQYVSANSEDFSCNYCGISYNPSEYRSGEVIRCENCKKIIRPEY